MEILDQDLLRMGPIMGVTSSHFRGVFRTPFRRQSERSLEQSSDSQWRYWISTCSVPCVNMCAQRVHLVHLRAYLEGPWNNPRALNGDIGTEGVQEWVQKGLFRPLRGPILT